MTSTEGPKPIDAGAAAILAKLDEGYAKIEVAADALRETKAFWLDLLGEYEAVYRTIAGGEAPRDE